MKNDKVARIYNSCGIELDKLQKSLDSTVMLAIVQAGTYVSDNNRIVLVQSLLSDNAGNQYALTLSGLAIPIDLLESVQSPETIMSDLKWAVTEK
jgi:hypothetical protein